MGSIKLGSVNGILVKIHWTFFFLPAWILFSNLASGLGLATALISVTFILALFVCVLLHEFGHAFAAKIYGIHTRDITLLPIGGVARLERMPKKPLQELVVAFAGPLVNVVIAGILLGALIAGGNTISLSLAPQSVGSFFSNLMFVNLFLVVFNMIPAFPLDGGRVFRAILAIFFGYGQATQIAAVTGQVIAVGLALLALFVVGNPFLIIISLFIFFAAAGEARGVRFQESLEGYKVGDAMLTQFQAVRASNQIEEVLPSAYYGFQRDFPVIEDSEVIGMVRREDLLAASLRNEGPVPIGNYMSTRFSRADVNDPLLETIENAGVNQERVIPVFSGENLVGLLDPNHMQEVLQSKSRRFTHNQPIREDGQEISPFSRTNAFSGRN